MSISPHAPRFLRLHLPSYAAALLLIAFAAAAQAQTTRDLLGGVWSNSANWSNGVPVNGDRVNFQIANRRASSSDNISSLTLSQLDELGAVGATTLAPGVSLTINGGGLDSQGGSAGAASGNGLTLSGTASSTPAGNATFANSAAIFNVPPQQGQPADTTPIYVTANGSTGHEVTPGRGTSYPGALVTFQGNSSAGPAILTANAGQSYSVSTGDSFVGGAARFAFTGSANGGTAAVQLNSSTTPNNSSFGTLDISGLTTTGTTFGSISGSGAIVLGGRNITVGSLNANTTFSGILSGSGGSLTQTGTGTLALSGANTFTGGTTVNSGTLQAGGGGNVFGTGGMTVNGGTLNLNAQSVNVGGLGGSGGTLVNNGGGAARLTVSGGNGTYRGVIADHATGTGTVALTISGGTTTLTGQSTYTGGTTVNAGGTLQLGDGSVRSGDIQNGNYIKGSVVDNGTLAYNFSDNGGIGMTTVPISGSGSLVNNGPGTLGPNDSSTYTGGTTVNAGTLYLDGTAATANVVLGSANGPLTVNGSANVSLGQIASNQNVWLNLSVGALNGNGGSITPLYAPATNTLTVGNGGASGTYTGVLTDIVVDNYPYPSQIGKIALTKVGVGTQTLAGANNYTGATQVQAGTLIIGGGGSLANTPVSVASDATFLVNANSSVSGDVTVNGTAGGTGLYGGGVSVNGGGIFNGAATISGPLSVANGGLVALNSGSLTANGNVSVASGGVMRFTNGASLVVGDNGSLVNNGTLDVITGSVSVPGGMINNGTILDASVVKAKSVSLDRSTSPAQLKVTIDSYPGHSYQLQRADTPTGTFAPVAGVADQTGATGTLLAFADPAPSTGRAFYRIAVDP